MIDTHIELRKVKSSDVSQLVKWFSDSRVGEYYEGVKGTITSQKVRDKYLTQDRVNRFVVELEKRAVGYIQYYPLNKEERAVYGYKGSNVYGLDQFIGEPALWGKGIGTRMILLMITYIKANEPAEILTMDPFIDNQRAIRAYEKLGFKVTKKLPNHDTHKGILKDAWLMELKLNSNAD